MGLELLKFWIQTVIDGVVLIFHFIYIYLECLVKAVFPTRLKSLEGEIILITGAGNGIGKDIAIQLTKSKAKLVCWDILKRDNEDTVSLLKSMGAEAFAYEVDVSEKSQVDATAARVKREIGDVTVIINNAGIGKCEKFLNFSPESIEKTFRINVLAHFWILRQFLPKMMQRNRGHIVTVCSIGGLKGNRYMVPYHGSKFAVHGYLESLKEELAHAPNSGDQIKFTTIYPTAVKTRLINGIRFAFRFPSFTPFLESSYVAERIVRGLRSNTERVYVPSYMPIYFFLEYFLPTKAQRALTDFMMYDFSPDPRIKAFGEQCVE